MSCIETILQEISNCDLLPRSGFEQVGWILNWDEASFTYGAYETLITLVETSGVAYEVTSIKKEMDAGFDLNVDDMGDSFSHTFSMQPYERDAASIVNMDRMNGIVLIGELKGSKTEGCFVAYGVDTGLYKSGLSGKVNAGIPQYTFSTPDGLGEYYSRYVIWDTDYETTKEMIEELTETFRLLLESGDGLLLESGGNILLE